MAQEKRKKHWGDRRDGRWVRDVPGLQTIMAHILPNRTDCEVFMKDSFDITELLPYLEAKNALHPDYKTTVFHALIMSVARMVTERPKMNRFVQGRRMYERYEISLGFVAKRRFQDNAEEALMFFVPEADETLDSMSYKIAGEVQETRKSESSNGGIDSLIDSFAKIPRLLLMLILRIVRWLDFWGVNPKALTDGDPNYSSVFLSNLGSIQAPAVYHHLNNYGTNSIMVTIGTIHKEERIMPDGSKQIRDVVDIGATLDERIADGFYFARSLKLVKHIFAHPELLDRPLNEPSGYDFK
ncbi:MAG: 2-oxo acid dehydrogenase subunit E2 [Oscillospiraceae bacterium]|nr:2-oxo acid dehydrogenase subunit E2 [Oscillospiraceae bacterium]